MSARNKEGIDELLKTVDAFVHGQLHPTPIAVPYSVEIEQSIAKLLPLVKEIVGMTIRLAGSHSGCLTVIPHFLAL